MTNRLTVVVSLLAALIVTGCVQYRLTEPCYDGWTTDDVGPSEVFQPADDEKNRILTVISPASSVKCFHALAQGDILVLFSDRSTATVRKSPDGYKLVERGMIIRAD